MWNILFMSVYYDRMIRVITVFNIDTDIISDDVSKILKSWKLQCWYFAFELQFSAEELKFIFDLRWCTYIWSRMLTYNYVYLWYTLFVPDKKQTFSKFLDTV